MINKIKSKIGEKTYKRGKNFGKYTFVGVIWTLLTIPLMWLFIDILKFKTGIGSLIAVAILFFTKYYAYLVIGLIERRFIKYASTSIGFSVGVWLLIWFLIDVLHLSTVISSAVASVAGFIFRFVVFDLVGLIKNE